jgi:hypothetical protein
MTVLDDDGDDDEVRLTPEQSRQLKAALDGLNRRVLPGAAFNKMLDQAMAPVALQVRDIRRGRGIA